MRQWCTVAAVVVASLCSFAPNVHAQGSWPSKMIKIIVAYPAGGANDIVAREVGKKMSDLLGQPVIIDNRGGAGGTIGADMAAKSPPDGYTLLMGAGGHTLAPSLYIKLPYDIVKDFAPVSTAAKGSYLLVLHPSVPANSVKELIALAKIRPTKLNYGSAGVGTPPHLAGEMFKAMAGVDMIHVPYKGDAPEIVDLLGGHLDLAFIAITPIAPHVKAGKLRALAVTGGQRTPVMPDLPTIEEAGGLKGYDISTWWGLLAPTGTPPEIVNRLSTTMGKIVTLPDIKERFAALGIEPAANTPEQFAKLIKAEVEKFAKLAKAAGVKPE